MSWRSFANLREGARRVPRVEELEALARMLQIDPLLVFMVARGVSADAINRVLFEGREAVLAELFSSLRIADADRGPPLRASLERLPCAVFTIDTKGRIKDYNAKLQVMASSRARTLVDAQLLDLVDQTSVPVIVKLEAEALERGESGPASVVLENGRTVVVSMVTVMHNGQPVGFQCRAALPAQNATSSGS